MNKCKFCGSESRQILENRIDYEYGNPTILNYWKCLNSNCEFVFVNPQPSLNEIQGFYNRYSTHKENYKGKLINPIAFLNKKLQNKYFDRLFKNANIREIKVLDFGCGNGNLLVELRKRGVLELFGYDFDDKATLFSQNEGLTVFSDYDKIKENGNYDFIFLNHVVEHLSHPEKDIENLSTFLKPNGIFIIRTPNSSSILCNLFKAKWRGWETPRHLGIFNYNNIENIAGSCKIEKRWTSNLMFSGIYNESIRSPFFTNVFLLKVLKHIFLPIVYSLSQIINLVFKKYGEEVCIILKKSRN